MTWQFIHLADVPASAWRNGGGVTRELMAWPDPQSWIWRISVADVASDGPFSRFDGVQRWLAILRGAGVRLRFTHHSTELRPTSVPLSFEGGAEVHCELLDGPVRDLNLMIRSERPGPAVTGLMSVVRGRSGFRLDATKTVAILALESPAEIWLGGSAVDVPTGTLAWRQLPAAAEVEIQATLAFWMEIGS